MQRYGNLLKHGLEPAIFNTILTYYVLKLTHVVIVDEYSVAICESLYVEDYGANNPGKSVHRYPPIVKSIKEFVSHLGLKFEIEE